MLLKSEAKKAYLIFSILSKMGDVEPYTTMSVRGVEIPPAFQVEPESRRQMRERIWADRQQVYPISMSGIGYQ